MVGCLHSPVQLLHTVVSWYARCMIYMKALASLYAGRLQYSHLCRCEGSDVWCGTVPLGKVNLSKTGPLIPWTLADASAGVSREVPTRLPYHVSVLPVPERAVFWFWSQ